MLFLCVEICEHPDHILEAEFATVLQDRAKAGCLLKRLGMKHGDEVFLLPLRHKVNKPEVLDQFGGVISDS